MQVKFSLLTLSNILHSCCRISVGILCEQQSKVFFHELAVKALQQDSAVAFEGLDITSYTILYEDKKTLGRNNNNGFRYSGRCTGWISLSLLLLGNVHQNNEKVGG